MDSEELIEKLCNVISGMNYDQRCFSDHPEAIREAIAAIRERDKLRERWDKLRSWANYHPEHGGSWLPSKMQHLEREEG